MGIFLLTGLAIFGLVTSYFALLTGTIMLLMTFAVLKLSGGRQNSGDEDPLSDISDPIYVNDTWILRR